jgi:hypothetical protein
MTGANVAGFCCRDPEIGNDESTHSGCPVGNAAALFDHGTYLMDGLTFTLANFSKRIPDFLFHAKAGATTTNGYISSYERIIIVHIQHFILTFFSAVEKIVCSGH